MLRAERPEEVPDLLAEVEAAAAAGSWAVGFVAYEAASGFDPALVTRPLHPGVPAAWFALFERARRTRGPAPPASAGSLVPSLGASVSESEYRAGIAAIHAAIARGDTYQVNYTYRLRGEVDSAAAVSGRADGPAEEVFARMEGAQRAPYASLVVLEGSGRAACSASPELFFRREEGRIVCRPMKGTAPRGRTLEEDRSFRDALRSSPKERAENLMIVDMVRNDLGRVATPGSVEVPTLFEVERYETVHQMTSTVVARSDASLPELFRALFPCASVTGAPKVRTMEILAALEREPRGVYTGAVGWVAPGGTARFSVAIRTAWLAPAQPTTGGAAGRRTLEYGTGGGVVWDSDPDAELEETRTKAVALQRALGPPEGDFELLESVLWTPRAGFVLLERHLERLERSAEYFGFPLDRRAVLDRIGRAVEGHSSRCKVRLLCARGGEVRAECRPVAGGRRVLAALAPSAVDSADRFLFHKTTRRSVYERALAGAREAEETASREAGREPAAIGDALLYNERGELTESTVANLVLELEGRLVTPPVSAGLLAGTLRAELLSRGRIAERRLRVSALAHARRIYLVSSVRGWRPVDLLSPPPRAG